MRFVFVDRILSIEPGRVIETLKNVSATEDVFDDHFPGVPILPGALVLEAFEQATQLLIGTTYSFARIGRLSRISRVSFRRFVRPGDQLRLRCTRDGIADDRWAVGAAADVAGQSAVIATMEFMIDEVVPGSDSGEHATRLRELLAVLRDERLALAGLKVSR